MKDCKADPEIKRLQAQRDRAWQTLGQVEDALGTVSLQGIAFILADSHGPGDCKEWNAVQKVAVMKAAAVEMEVFGNPGSEKRQAVVEYLRTGKTKVKAKTEREADA